jgi:hypothetical protein
MFFIKREYGNNFGKVEGKVPKVYILIVLKSHGVLGMPKSYL